MEQVTIRVNGRPTSVPRGTTVASAIAAAGTVAFRWSVAGEARGPLCGMGICGECRVTIDGVRHQRSCVITCRDGMEVRDRWLIIRAIMNTKSSCWGAARRASPLLVRRRRAVVAWRCWKAHPGWAGRSGGHGRVNRCRVSRDAGSTRLERSSVEVFDRTTAFGFTRPDVLHTERDDNVLNIGWHALVLAVGSQELFLPFPGWTLPNVVGAGGLQLLGKSGWPVAGKRVVVAGTGPLSIAVAAYLVRHGAPRHGHSGAGTAPRRWPGSPCSSPAWPPPSCGRRWVSKGALLRTRFRARLLAGGRARHRSRHECNIHQRSPVLDPRVRLPGVCLWLDAQPAMAAVAGLPDRGWRAWWWMSGSGRRWPACSVRENRPGLPAWTVPWWKDRSPAWQRQDTSRRRNACLQHVSGSSDSPAPCTARFSCGPSCRAGHRPDRDLPL